MRLFSSLVVGCEAYWIWMYALSFHLGRLWLDWTLRFHVPKPFVYRVLVPLISNGSASVYVMWMVFFAVGFFFATDYLYKSLGVNRHELASFFVCQVMFLATFYLVKGYDYATAFFFALMLALLFSQKHGVFLAVFALATLNRETTFLLIGFYAVWFWGKMQIHKYFANLLIMSALFASIRLLTQLVFSSWAGTDVWYTLPENLSVYARYWWASLPMFAVLILVILGASSEFTKKVVLFIFIPQVILFILSGKPFETRVFAESIVITLITAWRTTSNFLKASSGFRQSFVRPRIERSLQGLKDR